MRIDIKPLLSIISKTTRWLGNSPIKASKIIASQIKKLILILKDVEYALFPSKAKSGVVSVRQKTIKFYKRPMSDISHISIVLVILFALISGIPGAFSSANKVSIDPFVPIKTAKQEYISKTEKRILEADSVATLSSVYSDSLGQDAIKVAEDLNNKIAVATNNNDYLNSQPIISMPDVANTRNKIITYVVRDGDTLSGIAAKFNITTATIRYANKLEDENSVKPGQTLTILPITGLIHTVSAGDTLAGIAARYKANQEMIISQNDLYGEEIVAGMQLLIPDGEIPDAPKPVIAPVATPGSGSGSDDSDGLSYVKISYGPNHFPWGYCTWWVAQKRSVPWNGNAWQWYGNAQSYGRPTGRTPVPGAIMVTWESGVGHVAYVESVSGGSFTVSEMNYRGYGIVSSRTLTTSSVPLIGFIY